MKMNFFKFCFLFAVVIAVKTYTATADVLCANQHIARGLGFKQRKDSSEFYWLPNHKVNAFDARNFCLRFESELVHIKNDSENQFIKSFVANETEVWIGGVNTGNDVYKWVTGFNMTYTNFYQKTDDRRGVNYISIYGQNFENGKRWGYWNRNNENTVLKVMCVLRCHKL